jgi:aryl-alcohol dehydrogenase-like predicted oxidoreductase
MNEIIKQPFGKTGHMSTRTIFGSVCLKRATEEAANRILDLITKYGINHIDTAPGYGDAELRLGPWMKKNRDVFFLATKTDKVSYEDAKEQFYRSLERLQVDSVDLLQLHNLTDVAKRENIMGPGGALELLVEAKEQGLARFIGITGHGILAPQMHMQSLKRFDFDTVLLPWNYLLFKIPKYATGFDTLLSYCKEHNIPVQTIKSIAGGFWGNKSRDHVTWYRPLTDDEAITRAVQWVLGKDGVFLNTIGDMQLLPNVLEAAARFESQPSDDEMERLTEQMGMESIFSYL